MAKHQPVIWKGENVIGILKHTAAAKQNKKYQDECHDYRLASEQHWRDGEALREEELRVPGGTKGSQRFDFYAEKEKTIYDLKFGKQGITPSELAKMIKHGDPKAIIKEVRPSRMKTSDQEESIKKVN